VDFHGGRPDAPVPDARSADGRRLFKTHTPLDGLPLVDGVAVITLYRDPGESLLSMRRHLRNMTSPPPDHPNRGPLEKAFDVFLSRPLDRARFDGLSLSGLCHHFRSSEAVPVRRVHYADMSADPAAALRAIAACLGERLDPTSERAILAETAKRAMRRKSGSYTPEASTGLFKDDARFFSGRAQCAERLTGAQRARLIARARTDLRERSAAWLCGTERP
jgi:hypothetical protein